MIPESVIDVEQLATSKRSIAPSLTWRIDFEKKQIVGLCDELEAMRQAIYLRLSTERYQFPTHTWNYGIETNDLYQREKSFVIPQLQSRILDCLYQDDRIVNISAFKFIIDGRKYHVTFTVETIYNEDLTMEVDIYGE